MTYQEWQDWKAGEAAAGYESDDASTLKLENGFACFPDNDVLGEFYDIALVQRPLRTVPPQLHRRYIGIGSQRIETADCKSCKFVAGSN